MNKKENLFGEYEEKRHEIISSIYEDRLKTVFPEGGVLTETLTLHNQNKVLFNLCFACSNPSKRARETALRIAKHIVVKSNKTGVASKGSVKRK